MLRAVLVPLLLAALAVGTLSAADDDLVFHSDVSLVRVDTQVVDGSNRAIIHLHAGDFVVREDGRVAPIRNFAAENMPIDVLFLLDVSGSMRPHVQRIADAAGQALTELGKDDRMGIMVFDRNTRVRLAFNSSHQEVQREFDRLLREDVLTAAPISRAPCWTPPPTSAGRAAAMPPRHRDPDRRSDRVRSRRCRRGAGIGARRRGDVRADRSRRHAVRRQSRRGAASRGMGWWSGIRRTALAGSFSVAVAAVAGIREAAEVEQIATNRPAQRRSHAIRAETACR